MYLPQNGIVTNVTIVPQREMLMLHMICYFTLSDINQPVFVLWLKTYWIFQFSKVHSFDYLIKNVKLLKERNK